MGPIRFVAIAGLLVLPACGSRGQQDAAHLFAAATDQLRHGDLGQALALTDAGVTIEEARPVSLGLWKLRLLRAEILLLRRQTADAARLVGDRLPETSAYDALKAKQKYLEGQLQLLDGRLAEAVDTQTLAERMAIDAGERDVAFGARALRGQALLRLQRWEDGESTLGALIADTERAGDDYHLAIALINLGRAQLERHRHDAALAYLERAAGLERVTMRIRALAFTNAGLCYARLGDYERAIAMQRRAVEAQENGQPALLSHALGELGITYFFMGRDQEAITHLTRALQVAKQAGIDNFIQAWTANLAWGYIRLGQWDNADEFNQWSHKLNQAARSSERLVFNALYGGEIAEGRKRYNEARAQYAMVIKEPGKDPLNKSDAHAGLARVHLADGQPQFAARQFEAALDVIEKTQTSLVKTDYKITYLTRLTNVYGQYIDMLVGQRQHDRALEIADSSRARVLAERHGVAAGRKHTAREFKRIAAQSGSTLLQYWIGEKRSYAWAVTGSDIVSIELPKAAEIEALVRTYQTTIVNSLADPLQSTSTAGDKLYAMLVAPFARVLKPGSSVIVVPDGPLTRVNFETLPVDGPGRHYWIEDVSLSVAPSLGTLAASTPRNASSDRASVLLIGDPAPTDPEFPQLRHARTEIDAVANAFPKAEKAIYRGQEASPHAFRQARPERFGLIHFTAHASANAMSPLDSAVILSRDATGYKLYARDVAEQKLNAELVTISACRSAGDRTYSGEGLVGFAWAFLRAGAERVLAGLWDVDDRSTAELMTMVYAGLARGESPAAALRAAKRALIARGGPSAKPYYWGPFQLIVATP